MDAGELPTKELIDPVTRDTPVFVSRYDGHMGLANSARCALAGITAQTPDPPGGVIVRDAQGNPTGALKDAAMDLMYKIVPPLSHDQRLHAVKRALAHAASLGVTSVQHMNADFADIAVYAELRDRGELTARIYVAPLIIDVETLTKVGSAPRLWRCLSANRRGEGLTLTVRSARAPRTSSSLSPTRRRIAACCPSEMQPPSTMRDRMLKADGAGIQLCTHAIGDQGISIILDFYDDIVKKHGERRSPLPHRARAAHGGQGF